MASAPRPRYLPRTSLLTVPTLVNGAITDDATLIHAAMSNRRDPLGLALGAPHSISTLQTRVVREYLAHLRDGCI